MKDGLLVDSDSKDKRWTKEKRIVKESKHHQCRDVICIQMKELVHSQSRGQGATLGYRYSCLVGGRDW